MKILVTGSNGQLGYEFKQLAKNSDFSFTFTDIDTLDLTNGQKVLDFFEKKAFDYCINCAAYTAVDQAEKEKELAYLVNEKAVANLAIACNEHNVVLFHISTDFVFDGTAFKPLKEEDNAKPLSVYGASKLAGELVALLENKSTYILRTSWLYSTHGKNFVKTMISLAETRDELGVISDQVGTPTYAFDLAQDILKIINFNINGAEGYGLYHYSNEGVASWYDFAIEVFSLQGINIQINPIPTESYPTPAKRPHFSVMDKSKIKKTFDLNIPHWKVSLKEAIIKLKSIK